MVSDRLAMIAERRVIEVAPTDELRAAQNPVVQQFLTAMDRGRDRARAEDSHESDVSAAADLRVGVVPGRRFAPDRGLAIFAIGSQSGMFQSKTTLYAYFADVSGLIVGAPVRLAGLDVGAVSAIEFATELSAPRRASRCRSRASTCDAHSPRLGRDDRLARACSATRSSTSTLGIRRAPRSARRDAADAPRHRRSNISRARSTRRITAVTEVTQHRQPAIELLATEQVREDIARITHSTAGILEQVDVARAWCIARSTTRIRARDEDDPRPGASDTLVRLRTARRHASTPRWPRSSTATAWRTRSSTATPAAPR